jgi:hypothetical protein
MEIEDYEAATREWGRRNPGFIKPSVLKEPKKVKFMDERVAQMKRDLETPTAFKCSFCDRTFEKLRGREVHQSQCDKNPNAMKWARTGTKHGKRGAPKGNQYARKQPVEERIPETVTVNTGALNIDTEALSSAFAAAVRDVPHTVGQPPATVPPPSPAAPVPARATFPISRLYDYLLAGILLAILLCGIIYAALGIKLLVGW